MRSSARAIEPGRATALGAADGAALLTVERGLEVLRAFRSGRAPLSNSELVRRTGLPKATVSRLTSTLMQTGFLAQVPGHREFELTTGALGIGHSFLSTSELLQAAQPLLQALADRLDVSVALGIGCGRDMLYVGYRVGRQVATLRLGVGSVLPMASTAIGRAYLWGLPAAAQQRLVADLARHCCKDPAAFEQGLRQSFAELDARGTCAVLGGHQRGTYAVALPVRLGRERVLMGLSCGKADVDPRLEAERRRIAPALVEAARELESGLRDIESPL